MTFAEALNAEYEALVSTHPQLEDSQTASLLEQHSWWIRPVLRMENKGCSSIRMFEITEKFGKMVTGLVKNEEYENQERYCGVLDKKKLWDKYVLVKDSAPEYGLDSLMDGRGRIMANDIKLLTEEVDLDGLVEWELEVVLPKELSTIDYPFPVIRRGIPPPPDTLRVLLDGRIDVFKHCFSDSLRESLDREELGAMTRRRRFIRRLPNGYWAHSASENSYRNLMLELIHNHSCSFYITLNETLKTVDFAFRQRFMHRKHWAWKFEKLKEHFGENYPEDFNPASYYNRARRLAREINSYLKAFYEEDRYKCRTFPEKFNP